MTAERRLVETLRRVDRYQPSPDLFARVQRSIAEDIAHRRRRRRTVVAVAASVIVGAVYVAAVVTVDPSGRALFPKWSVELLETVALTGLLLALAPALRRYGADYAADAFCVDPATSVRFLRLLDIAYYLFFTGLVLTGVDLSDLWLRLPVADQLADAAFRIAQFLLVMGVAHAVNLAVLPVIGLVHNAVVWRARRRAVGPSAPAPSPATRAERVANWIVFGVAGVVLAGALLLVGVVVGIGLSA